MQTTTLLSAGTSAAASDPVEIEDGQVITLTFIGEGKIMLLSVDDQGNEEPEENLTSTSARSRQVAGPYRIRLRRSASDTAVGMKMFRS